MKLVYFHCVGNILFLTVVFSGKVKRRIHVPKCCRMLLNVNKKIKAPTLKEAKQQSLLEKRFTVFYGIWENYNYNDKIVS